MILNSLLVYIYIYIYTLIYCVFILYSESENTTTEGDALSVKDLDTIPTSSPHIPTSSSNKVVRHFTQRSSSSDVGLPEVDNEKESEQISTHVVAPSKGRDEQSKQLVKRGNLGTESSANDIKRIFKDSSAQVIPHSVVPENHKTTSDAEDIVGNMALTSDVGSLDVELKLESEHLVDEAPHERLRTPSDKVKSRGSTTDHSEIQTFSKFQGPEELTLDGMWERREKKGAEDDNEDHHTNASLDMDELEERRRKDMKYGEVVVDYHTQSERGSEKSISVAEQER